MKEKNNNQLPNKLTNSYSELLRSIDDFFSQTFKNFHNNGLFTPSFPVRAYEANHEYIIEAELPGVNKEQIKLDIYQNHVRIAVLNNEIIEEHNEKENYRSYQQTSHSREQIVPVPFPVTEKDVKASYHNGLLQVRFPNKRKTIEIE
ncbi:Hsp20/alpha crystallin family protein [Bacillus sp. FJAT-45350]|uniref:Hsp20/alpha crystallin family protein n=1 Tax=Bacillus sp. FJAT-45350 TaxID=2011014 RepID=UPI000BB8F21C|nr:Hsp20/alpha crystallin family protein [Bacillus sp. FJAT-45350]